MLRLQNIVKNYKVADTTVQALKGISISFRANEFVSILGPSGCGKTTTLNIIGGLDHYSSGDLFINGKSTKMFKDRDWDVYRNHRVGFIFQSYNLIPHQTIVENVELALTIAGMDKQERIEKARNILDKVGLQGQYNKKPNQLSGGQCQRVAIARALVNDPEILLADEPTGALDTQTSIQIMELIKEIAKERLVIMVTHNPELAEKYSSRIIRLVDGEVVSDTMPFSEEEEIAECQALKNKEEKETEGSSQNKKKETKEKARMSMWTAFKLSWRNLKSKFRRTLMVCLAGSIGIIGVSAVLAVRSGVTNYINGMQDDMLSGNPVKITESGYDLSKMMSSLSDAQKAAAVKKATKDGYVDIDSMMEYVVNMANARESFSFSNDITAEYIRYLQDMPKEYYSEITYKTGIDVRNNIYTDFRKSRDSVNKSPSVSVITQTYTSVLEESPFGSYSSMLSTLSDAFEQAPSSEDYILSQYDILAGDHLASAKDEIMIVVNSDTELTDVLLAELGYYTQEEFLNLGFKAYYKCSEDENGNNVCKNDAENSLYDPSLDKEENGGHPDGFSYEELLNHEFHYYPNDTIYEKGTDMEVAAGQYFHYAPYEADFTEEEKSEGFDMKVVTILRPKKDVSYGCMSAGFFYTKAFADYFVEDNKESEIVKYFDVLTASKRESDPDADAVESYSSGHISVGGVGIDTGITYDYTYQYLDDPEKTAVGFVGESDSTASILNAMTGGALGITSLNTLSLRMLGGSELANEIDIYPVDFDIKDKVTDYLDTWNNSEQVTLSNGEVLATGNNEISYTDNLAIVISLIGTMINIISYALIAFTSISLVVSTVMIGIITYVSVVERIKEIGVIRSLGGRTKDVAHLFNAETAIIGLFSGILGIAITYLLSGIMNLIIGSLSGIYTIASLPVSQAVVMIIISIILTLISGLVPASSAAHKDPVVALRTE